MLGRVLTAVEGGEEPCEPEAQLLERAELLLDPAEMPRRDGRTVPDSGDFLGLLEGAGPQSGLDELVLQFGTVVVLVEAQRLTSRKKNRVGSRDSSWRVRGSRPPRRWW